MALQLCPASPSPRQALAPKPVTVRQLQARVPVNRPAPDTASSTFYQLEGAHALQITVQGQPQLQSSSPAISIHNCATPRPHHQRQNAKDFRSGSYRHSSVVLDEVIHQVLWTVVDCRVQRTDRAGVHVAISWQGQSLPGYIYNQELARRGRIRRLAAACPGQKLQVCST